MEKKVRISFPHLGNLYIPLKALFDYLKVDYVIPPLNSQRTLTLGTKYSPEGLCIPFKLTLGNMIEAAEQGADTMIMPGGFGICRLGYYTIVQEKILNDLGISMQLIPLSVSEHKFKGFMQIIKRLSGNAPWSRIIAGFRFGIAKMDTLDEIEKLVQKIRPLEKVKGETNRVFRKAIEAIDASQDYATLRRVRKDYILQLYNIPSNRETQPLIVGLIGEFYVLLEPFSNLDIEKELGKLGVEVRRSLYISEWTKFSLFFGALKKLRHDKIKEIHKAALPYLKCDVGGDGWETVGEKVLYAENYDGLVHLAPLTCMPETVAQNIMPSTKEKIPVLTVICDEQMGKQGMITRLEAFVDLLKRRKQKVQNYSKEVNILQ